MQGHCWFALRVGNAAWHTVNNMGRETHSLKGGETVQVEQTFYHRLEASYLWHSEPVKLCLHCVCFTNTLTKPPTSGYEVEVVKHTLATTLSKFMLQWERRGTFTSFCYLNSLMFWVMEKVYFAYSNMDLMKLTHPGLRECVQCRLAWALCLCKWWRWGQKCLRVRAKISLDSRYAFFHLHDNIGVDWERKK